MNRFGLTRVLLPYSKVWSGILAMKPLNVFRVQNTSKESLASTTSQWLLSCFLRLLCILKAPRVTKFGTWGRREETGLAAVYQQSWLLFLVPFDSYNLFVQALARTAIVFLWTLVTLPASSAHACRGLGQESKKMFLRFINLEVVSHQILLVWKHICTRNTVKTVSRYLHSNRLVTYR